MQALINHRSLQSAVQCRLSCQFPITNGEIRNYSDNKEGVDSPSGQTKVRMRFQDNKHALRNILLNQ